MTKSQTDLAAPRHARAKSTLKNTAQHYHHLYESIRDAILVVDPSRCIVGCNPAFEALFGYSENEAVGQQTALIYENQKHDLDLCRLFDQSTKTEDLLFTGHCRKRSGDVFPGETHVVRIMDDRAETTGFMLFIRDVTQRMTAEKEYRSSEERFAILVENLYETIIVVDQSGTIQYINRSGLGLFNAKAAELIGKPFGFPVTIGESFEMEILQKDGTVRYAEMQATQIEWKGHPASLCSLRDNTEKQLARIEREQMNAHLQQIQKIEAIGTLAGGIAHDFNNILSPIIGFTELAMERLNADPVAQDCLEQVYHAGIRAKDLVKQILSFSRKSEIEFQPLLLSGLVKEVLKMLRSTLPTTISIHQHIESEQVVKGDATGVHQILMNLCTNAKHAMEDSGGALTVSLTDEELPPTIAQKNPHLQPGSYIRLRVEDTGCGMEPAVTEKIFEPYFTTKETGRGTGLGMAVVYGIVADMQGAIGVDSVLGQGTVVDVYLPGSQYRQKQGRTDRTELKKGDEHILCVDDEPSLVKLNQQILQNLGYTVTSRTSSIEALELFKNKPGAFDLLITDMTMPNMTGETLAVHCRGIRPELPVVLTTGFSEKLDENKAKEMGIEALVFKPISKTDLADIVRNVLDSQKTKD